MSFKTGFTTPSLALCADSKAGLKALVAHVSKQDSGGEVKIDDLHFEDHRK